MTVNWQMLQGGRDTVCCLYTDADNKEQVVKVRPEILEPVPPRALKRLQRKKNQSGLKALFENHPVIVYFSIAVVFAGLGANSVGWIEKAANQELVSKGTYTLNSEIQKVITQQYVDRRQNESTVSENTDLKTLIKKLTEKNNADILKQIAALTEKRETTRKSLEEIRARNSPMFYFQEPGKVLPVSKEEQDALDSIKDDSSEIMALYSKIKS